MKLIVRQVSKIPINILVVLFFQKYSILVISKVNYIFIYKLIDITEMLTFVTDIVNWDCLFTHVLNIVAVVLNYGPFNTEY